MLYIDSRMIEGSGIASYLSNLIKTYNKERNNFDIHYLVKEKTSIISEPPYFKNQHLFDEEIYSMKEQFFYPKILSKKDVLHVPHYNAPLLFSGKLIVTVHDICHFVMKDYFTGFPKRAYASIFMKMVLNKADKIISVSNINKVSNESFGIILSKSSFNISIK